MGEQFYPRNQAGGTTDVSCSGNLRVVVLGQENVVRKKENKGRRQIRSEVFSFYSLLA